MEVRPKILGVPPFILEDQLKMFGWYKFGALISSSLVFPCIIIDIRFFGSLLSLESHYMVKPLSHFLELFVLAFSYHFLDTIS